MVGAVRAYEGDSLEHAVFAVFAPDTEQAFRAELEMD